MCPGEHIKTLLAGPEDNCIRLLFVLSIEDLEVVLREPPELLDHEADWRKGGDQQREEDTDLAVLEAPHAGETHELYHGEGGRHLLP